MMVWTRMVVKGGGKKRVESSYILEECQQNLLVNWM